MRSVHVAGAGLAVAILAWQLSTSGPQRSGREEAARPTDASARDSRLPASPFGSGPAVTGPDGAEVLASDEPPSADTMKQDAPDLSIGAASKPPGGMVDAGTQGNSYLANVAQFRRFLWDGAAPAQLRPQALALDNGLAAQLAGGDLSPDEAIELKADLLDVLEPSATRRGQLLLQWRERYLASQDGSAAGQRRTREGDRGREAAIVAAWQALPSEDRDAGELNEQLQALQRGGAMGGE